MPDITAEQHANEVWYNVASENSKSFKQRTWEVDELYLAAISKDIFDDESIVLIMKTIFLSSEEDLREIIAIIDKYRPELSEQIYK